MEPGGALCRPRLRLVIPTRHKPWCERPRLARAYLALARIRRVAHAMVCLSVIACLVVRGSSAGCAARRPRRASVSGPRWTTRSERRSERRSGPALRSRCSWTITSMVSCRIWRAGFCPAIRRLSLALRGGVVHALRVRFDRACRAAFGHGRRHPAAQERGNCLMAVVRPRSRCVILRGTGGGTSADDNTSADHG
jgi:hypothetical protein